MERTKRQRQNSDEDDDNTRNKRTNDSNELSIKSYTRFEDFPNELLYEIFEFLDVYHMHRTFYNLNQRFRSLLADSTIPIRMNLSTMSKSTFDHYYKQMVILNQRRISFLRLSNLFTIDFVFPSIRKISKLTRLETLTITNLQSNYLGKLLKYLSSLSYLSSLTLILTDCVEDKNKFYRRIFRLPVLKYCKLSLMKSIESDLLSIVADESSSIEHLVLNNGCELHELISLLFYVPQVRRLSLQNLYGTLIDQIELDSIVLNYLTTLSINKTNLTFDELELLIRNHFQRIEILHFSRNFDQDFLNTNRWEQLIVSHMSQLRIFDLNIVVVSSDNHQKFEKELSRFHSPFWFERQWFFSHHIYSTSVGSRLNLFSTNPYRRKCYTIGANSNDQYTIDHHQQTNQNSVQFVRIEDEKGLIDCKIYFPNTRELSLSYKIIDENHNFFANILNRILPLQQLTKLVIDISYYHSKTIIELLCSTSNINTLVLNCSCLAQSDLIAIQQDNHFQSAAKTNKITNLIILTRCTFETMKLLVHLCPQSQHLTMNIYKNDFETSLRFLWSKDNVYLRHLFSLHLQCVHEEQIIILDQLLQTEKSLDHYFKKVSDVIPANVYLWW